MLSGVDNSITLSLTHLAATQPWLASLAILGADYGVLLLPAALVVMWCIPARSQPFRRKAIVSGCLAAGFAFGLGLALERTLGRPRPFAALGFPPLIPHAIDSSFPSDHTLVGVALIGAVAVRSRWLGAVLLGWAVLVGVARITAGLHYASDILGSAVLALIIAEGAYWIAGPLLTRMPIAVRRLHLPVRH